MPVLIYTTVKNKILKTKIVITYSFLILLCSINKIKASDSIPSTYPDIRKDTTRIKISNQSYLLSNQWVRQGIAPTALLTSGFLTWGERENIRGVRNRYVPNFSNRLDDYLQYGAAIGVVGLNIAGQKGRNGWKRQTISWAGSMLIMGVLVNSVKYTSKVMRPDGTSYNSFPSGHTATAFMNATFLHKEYGHINPLYSVAGYTSSSYVGASRSLNNRHWISDILVGAAIGIISTELSYTVIDHFYRNKGDYFSGFTIEEEISKPSYLSARIGYSFDLTDAKVEALGVESTLEGAYYFNRRWGVLAEATFGHYPLNPNGENIVENFEISDIMIRSPRQDFQSMGMLYFMTGPQYAKFIGSKFLLQAKLTTGMIVGTNGEMSLVGIAENKNSGMKSDITLPFVEYKARLGLALGTGVNFTAMMTPRVGLSWFVDYKYTRLTFDIKPSEKTFGNQLDYIKEKTSFSLNNMSTGLKFTAFLY